jgi:hypothetical protein
LFCAQAGKSNLFFSCGLLFKQLNILSKKAIIALINKSQKKLSLEQYIDIDLKNQALYVQIKQKLL